MMKKVATAAEVDSEGARNNEEKRGNSPSSSFFPYFFATKCLASPPQSQSLAFLAHSYSHERRMSSLRSKKLKRGDDGAAL